MRALSGGKVSDPDLADALVCDVLSISWGELQEMPESVLVYRLAIAQERARIAKASQNLHE